MSRFAALSGKAYGPARFGAWACPPLVVSAPGEAAHGPLARIGAALVRVLLERHARNLEAARTIGWSPDPLPTAPRDEDESEGDPGGPSDPGGGGFAT